MGVAAYFARDPAAARAQFLRAAGTIGVAVATHRLPTVDGGTVDMLAARLGSPEARRLLVLTPGTKPEDALCAAAVAVGCLRERLRRSIPRGVAMILLQIDDPARVLAPDAMRLADDDVTTGPRWNDSVLAAAETRYAAYQRDRVPFPSASDAAVRRLPEETGQPFFRLVETEMGQAERVAILDLATGPGAYGQSDVVAGHPPGTPDESRSRALFSARPVADGFNAAAMPGPLARGIVSALTVEATVAAIAFGTYSVRAVVHSMLGRPEQRQTTGSGMFYPDAEDWKLAVWSGAAEVIRGALIGLDGS